MNEKTTKPVPLATVPEINTGEATRTEPIPPALPVDLQSLPDDVLAVLAGEAPKELERRRNKRESEFLETVRAQAQALGVSPERLKAALFAKSMPRARAARDGDRRHHVAAKYKDPKTGRTWSGRGNAPGWFSEHVAAAGNDEALRIVEGAV